jgi:hypothetical protein
LGPWLCPVGALVGSACIRRILRAGRWLLGPRRVDGCWRDAALRKALVIAPVLRRAPYGVLGRCVKTGFGSGGSTTTEGSPAGILQRDGKQPSAGWRFAVSNTRQMRGLPGKSRHSGRPWRLRDGKMSTGVWCFFFPCYVMWMGVVRSWLPSEDGCKIGREMSVIAGLDTPGASCPLTSSREDHGSALSCTQR